MKAEEMKNFSVNYIYQKPNMENLKILAALMVDDYRSKNLEEWIMFWIYPKSTYIR